MLSILEELWIFSKDGLPIAEFCKNKDIDKALIGGFISAIKTICQEQLETDLSSFKMENFKFTIAPMIQGNAILVLKSKQDTSNKKLQKVCKIIIDIFESLFSVKDLKNWDGNFSAFDKFRNKLDLYFKMGNL